MFIAAALVIFVLDRLTKTIAVSALSRLSTRPLIPDIFHLTLVRNQGAAFGMLKGWHYFFLAVAAVTAGTLIYLYLRKEWREKLGELPLGLILGGTLGNLYDRFFLGAVIDFLDFRVWPVFNIADSAITIGVILLILRLGKNKWKKVSPSGLAPLRPEKE